MENETIKTNSVQKIEQPNLLFGYPFWVSTLLFWSGFIISIMIGFAKLPRETYLFPVALIIASFVLKRQYMTAVKTFFISLLLFVVFLQWGKKGSLIAGLILMMIVFIVIIIDVIKHKERYVKLYISFEKIMDNIFKKVK